MPLEFTAEKKNGIQTKEYNIHCFTKRVLKKITNGTNNAQPFKNQYVSNLIQNISF